MGKIAKIFGALVILYGILQLVSFLYLWQVNPTDRNFVVNVKNPAYWAGQIVFPILVGGYLVFEYNKPKNESRA